MNWKVFKFTLVIILLIIFTALSLPQLNFFIGDKQIYYPNIDFSLIDKDSKTGNFTRGVGLYPTKEVGASISFTSTDSTDSDKRLALENYLQIIRNRIVSAGLKDVQARSEIVDGSYKIVINYPDYYSNPVKYTQWLTGQGNFTFASLDQTSGTTQAVDLTDKDIYGSVSVNFISAIGSHLQFQFDSSKQATVTAILGSVTGSQVGFMLMDIDNTAQFFVRQYEQNDETTATVRAIPVDYSSGESVDKNVMLAIIRTYFLDKSSLKDSFVTDQTVKVIPSTFSPDGTKFITIMSFVALVILVLASFIKLKLEGGIKFTLMIGLFTTLTITLLKYSNASLSIGTLVGVLFAVGIVSLISWNLILEKDEDNLDLKYKKFLNLSFGLIVLVVFLASIVKGIYLFYDFSGVLLISGISLLFMSYFGFKAINYLKIKRK